MSRWINASTNACAAGGGTLTGDSGTKTTIPVATFVPRIVVPILGTQPASKQTAWSCPANTARSSALFGATIPSERDSDGIAINSCPANGRRSSTNLTFSSSGRKRLSVRRRSFFSACRTRSLASCARRLFSLRRSVSTRPALDETMSSPKTPPKTIAVAISPSTVRCGHIRSKTLCGRNRDRAAKISIPSPAITIAVQIRSHTESRSDQSSSALRMAVFGIPRRRRRSLGLIEIAIWVGRAALVWVIL